MKKKLIWTTIISLFFVLIITYIANYKIENTYRDQIYSEITKLPHHKVGLLLGTSKYLKSGRANQYFSNRIIATYELYRAGKIDNIVISGDNSRSNYNEPLDMQNELIQLGIPQDKIYLDLAGFRTYDSVVRINKIFGQTDFTIISQKFHNERAVYIAKSLKLNAIAYNAQDVDAYNGFKTQVREKFARVKVYLDLLINIEPHFLGAKITIK
jgi:SanA protein